MNADTHTTQLPASFNNFRPDAITLEHDEAVLFSYQLERNSKTFAFHFIWSSSEYIPMVKMMGKGNGRHPFTKKSPYEICLS